MNVGAWAALYLVATVTSINRLVPAPTVNFPLTGLVVPMLTIVGVAGHWLTMSIDADASSAMNADVSRQSRRVMQHRECLLMLCSSSLNVFFMKISFTLMITANFIIINEIESCFQFESPDRSMEMTRFA